MKKIPYEEHVALRTDEYQAEKLYREYNDLPYSATKKRTQILKKLLGKCDDTTNISSPFKCAYGYNIFIGKNLYANCGLCIIDCDKITIGDDCLIGPNCIFAPVSHKIDTLSHKFDDATADEIVIGNNVWIGAGVIILQGVHIGDNSVVGAGSVVDKDVPANTVVAGNPIRTIRKIRIPKNKLSAKPTKKVAKQPAKKATKTTVTKKATKATTTKKLHPQKKLNNK